MRELCVGFLEMNEKLKWLYSMLSSSTYALSLNRMKDIKIQVRRFCVGGDVSMLAPVIVVKKSKKRNK